MKKFEVTTFNEMLKWSKKEYHSLPWRLERTTYRTLVSEIMLQQTTVSTVLNHFERFLEEYPSLEVLAQATEEQIQVSWKGLGYYRRARNLLKAAKFIVENYAGVIPKQYDLLVAIPGIGDYTANAILAIGNNHKAIAVDANIGRVLSRFWLLPTQGLSPVKLVKEVKANFDSNFQKAKSYKRYRELNEGLMDVGRVFCQARKASCLICPLNKDCQAFNQCKINQLIVKKEKKVQKYYELDLLRLIVRNRDQKILMQHKQASEWLQGQYELPTFVIKSEDSTLKQYHPISLSPKKLPKQKIKSAITKYKINNYYQAASKQEVLQVLDRKTLPKHLVWLDAKDSRVAHVSLKILKAYEG